MIKKVRQSVLADKDSFLLPSSSMLDNHFDEIVEATEEVLKEWGCSKRIDVAAEDD